MQFQKQSNSNFVNLTEREIVQDDKVDETGKFGDAVEFDGVNDYVGIGDDNSLDLIEVMGFSVWVAPDFTQGGANAGVVFDKRDTNNGYRLIFNSVEDDWRFQISKSETTTNCDTTGLTWNAGEWHHVAGSYDRTVMRIYWDGVLENTCSYSGGIGANANSLKIGETFDGFNDFDGKIDEVLIFNRSLSVGEIKALYNASVNPLDVLFDELDSGDYLFRGFGVNGSGDRFSTEAREVTVVSDGNKFFVRYSLGEGVAWLGDEGNIWLSGRCFSGGSCDNPGNNSFIIANNSDNNVAFINSSGDLCVERGSCEDLSPSCNPSRDAFIIRNSSDNNVSYIDFDGELCLTGELIEESRRDFGVFNLAYDENGME